jgi:hypothetical protein
MTIDPADPRIKVQKPHDDESGEGEGKSNGNGNTRRVCNNADGSPWDPNETTKHCWICRHDVSEKSMHCKFCNKCVDTFDHHCMCKFLTFLLAVDSFDSCWVTFVTDLLLSL